MSKTEHITSTVHCGNCGQDVEIAHTVYSIGGRQIQGIAGLIDEVRHLQGVVKIEVSERERIRQQRDEINERAVRRAQRMADTIETLEIEVAAWKEIASTGIEREHEKLQEIARLKKDRDWAQAASRMHSIDIDGGPLENVEKAFKAHVHEVGGDKMED